MPFSEKHTVALSLLTLLLLVALIMYAGGLSTADAHASVLAEPAHIARSEVAPVTPEPFPDETHLVVAMTPDAGVPAVHDDLWGRMLRECISTDTCWTHSRHSPDGGDH